LTVTANPSPRLVLRIAAALALAAAVAACETHPGTVLGDAYIVTDDGGTIGLGRMPVRVIPESEEIDTLLATACPRPKFPRRDQVITLDSAKQAQAWVIRQRILSARVTRTLQTDARAHFAIDTLAPGKYRLWADTTYDGTRWTWLAPLRVGDGDTVRIALSNANPDENPFRCRV
jgi:FtsP/CotA-like multicopper oxidase with cupredoxin domain